MMGQKNMEKYWLPWLVGMPAETSRAICSIIFGGILDNTKSVIDALGSEGLGLIIAIIIILSVWNSRSN